MNVSMEHMTAWELLPLVKSLVTETERLEATITSLRTELERKDAALLVLSDHFIHGYGDNTRGGVIRAVENIARAALSAQKEEEA